MPTWQYYVARQLGSATTTLASSYQCQYNTRYLVVVDQQSSLSLSLLTIASSLLAVLHSKLPSQWQSGTRRTLPGSQTSLVLSLDQYLVVYYQVVVSGVWCITTSRLGATSVPIINCFHFSILKLISHGFYSSTITTTTNNNNRVPLPALQQWQTSQYAASTTVPGTVDYYQITILGRYQVLQTCQSTYRSTRYHNSTVLQWDEFPCFLSDMHFRKRPNNYAQVFSDRMNSHLPGTTSRSDYQYQVPGTRYHPVVEYHTVPGTRYQHLIDVLLGQRCESSRSIESIVILS